MARFRSVKRAFTKSIAVLILISLAVWYAMGNISIQVTIKHIETKETIVKQRPLAVLSTTFSNRTDSKLNVYTTTIKNWAEFLPDIQPVLFTPFPSGPVIDIARQHGWHVHSIKEVNRFGKPVMKSMYLEAYKYYDSYLYGWSCGDILYDDGLLDTIKLMHKHRMILGGAMMFGIRFNYNISSTRAHQESLWKPSTVRMLVKRNHALMFRPYEKDATDYHFVTRDYPWHEIKPVVIGRQGYDNYIIAETARLGLSTIHASGSIAAVHQTDFEGNLGSITTSFHNPDDNYYNRRMVGSHTLYLPQGRADHAKYKAKRNIDGVTARIECLRQCKPPLKLY